MKLGSFYSADKISRQFYRAYVACNNMISVLTCSVEKLQQFLSLCRAKKIWENALRKSKNHRPT